MESIKIIRPNEFINNFRSYKIWLDNQNVATISNDESIELPLTYNAKSLKFSIDGVSSNSINIATIDNIEGITIKVFVNRWIKFLLIILLLSIVIGFIDKSAFIIICCSILISIILMAINHQYIRAEVTSK